MSQQTDLLRFDAFVAEADLDAKEIAVGGFLPAVQIKAKGGFATFFFNDDGSLFDVSVVASEQI